MFNHSKTWGDFCKYMNVTGGWLSTDSALIFFAVVNCVPLAKKTHTEYIRGILVSK